MRKLGQQPPEHWIDQRLPAADANTHTGKVMPMMIQPFVIMILGEGGGGQNAGKCLRWDLYVTCCVGAWGLTQLEMHI